MLTRYEACDLAFWYGYAAGEVCQLVELVEVLGSLQQDLLVVRKVVVWIQVLVPEDGHVLLQISDLIVEVDELLGLLLEQKRPVGDVELHDGLLLLIDALQVQSLVSEPLHAVCSLAGCLQPAVGWVPKRLSCCLFLLVPIIGAAVGDDGFAVLSCRRWAYRIHRP